MTAEAGAAAAPEGGHRIDRLGHRGDGIAPGPIYVARALPGEVVAGAEAEGRIAAPEILLAAPERVAPVCPHYDACGGCDLMHASDAFVASWKVDRVRGALADHGLAAPIRGIATSPPRSRRRAVLAARRTKSGALAGFHGRRSTVIAEVPQCQVLTPALIAALPLLQALARAGASRKGTLAATLTDTPAGLDIAVRGGLPADHDRAAALVALAADAPVARLSWEGTALLQRAAPHLPMGPARILPPPGAFLQATRHGEAALQAAVAEALAGAERVVDLFSGCGTFALPLAPTAEVHAVEADAGMLAALATAAAGVSGLRPVTTEVRDLHRAPLDAAALSRFDGAVMDPPRAGGLAQARALAAAPLARIAMVSCNPGSFARDTAELCAAGFGIAWVEVVDQFRWSPHVEVVAALQRR